MRLRTASIIDQLRLKKSSEHVESSASIQLVCPYCKRLTTESVIMVFGGDEVYRCDKTYDGPGCGREYRGPA